MTNREINKPQIVQAVRMILEAIIPGFIGNIYSSS